MRKILIATLLTSALVAPVWADDKPAAPAAESQEQALAKFRSDLQAKRAEVIAKNVTLNAEQAAKFWPLFEAFQAEQSAVIDEQVAGIKQFVERYETLTDADAIALVNTQLTRDDKMHALRVEWLEKFRKVVPDGTAARVIQIDRRLGQITQVLISDSIPLVR